MKFKLDENVPNRAAALLEEYGHSAATVAEERLTGRSDEVVWDAATAEGRMLLTLDRGFADIRRYPPGHHPGVVLMRLQDQSAALVESTLRALLSGQNLDDLSGCTVIAQPGVVRVRRP